MLLRQLLALSFLGVPVCGIRKLLQPYLLVQGCTCAHICAKV